MPLEGIEKKLYFCFYEKGVVTDTWNNYFFGCDDIHMQIN